MSDHLTREELRHDEVGEALERGVQYVADNWKRIAIGAGLLAVMIIAGSFWAQQRHARADEGAYALYQAISSGEESAAASLDSVIKDYSGSTSRIARLYRATFDDVAKAEHWQKAVNGNIDLITVVATTNQVRALRASGEHDEALALLEGDSVGLPEDLKLYERALTLRAAGQEQGVKSVIDELLQQYPDSPWASEVRTIREIG